MEGTRVSSVCGLVHEVLQHYREWEIAASGAGAVRAMAWFRGEPEHTSAALCPALFRDTTYRGRENELLQNFRDRAPVLGLDVHNLPLRKETDQWLYLAQHVRLPTRLLDWTEGLLIALHFALEDAEKYCSAEECEECPPFEGGKARKRLGAVIWMLNPLKLNGLSGSHDDDDNELPLAWFAPERQPPTKEDVLRWALAASSGDGATLRSEQNRYGRKNPAAENLRRAWEEQRADLGTEFPVAIRPTHIHFRMSNQRSCFTIWGKEKWPEANEPNPNSLEQLLSKNNGGSPSPHILRRYDIDQASVKRMREDLRLLGITHATLFPDLDNLAKVLKEECRDARSHEPPAS